MSERDISHGRMPPARGATTADAGGLGGMFTMLESSALLLSAFTLFLLYGMASAQSGASRPVGNDAVWMFVPHILLIALIVGGLRRVAAVVATFLLLGGFLLGLAACLSSLTGSHEMQDMGFASVLQLPIFILCFYSARQPFSLAELARRGPRLTLGAVVAGIGWFAGTAMVARANAPYRARMAAVAATERREAARRDARWQVAAIAACLQRVRVTADSQPVFPAALADLPMSECPAAARPAPAGFVVEYFPGDADSAGRHRAFRLSAHDQPVTDSARAYETDESMVLVEWYGRGNRRSSMGGASAMEAVAQFARCIEEARDTASSAGVATFPGSLAELLRERRCSGRPNADSSAMFIPVGNGSYRVTYEPALAPRHGDAPGGYTLSFESQHDSIGQPTGAGLLSFLVDSSATVHVTRRGRAATADDPAVPSCPSYEARSRIRIEPICTEWVARQRWGLRSQLPTIGWSRSGSGTVGAGDTLFVIPQYQPVTSSDSIVEAHIQWDASRPDSTLRRRAGRLGEPLGSGVSIRLQHAYADTGMKRIRFWLRTGAGDQYEFRDSVRVLLPRRYR